MTPFEILRNLLALAGVAGLAYALKKSPGGQHATDDGYKLLGEDAPIRVKGGSINIHLDKEDIEWHEDEDDGEYRPKPRPNHWRVRLWQDGAEQKGSPAFGRLVEIDMVSHDANGNEVVTTVKFKAKGSIRVLDNVVLRKFSRLVLKHHDANAYMRAVRVLRSASPKTFGPYDAVGSETLDIELKPLR